MKSSRTQGFLLYTAYDLLLQFTVVGKQVDGILRPFHMAPGVEVATVRPGLLSAEEVFWMEHSNNRWIAWGFRVGGWVLAFVGCNCIGNIFTVLGENSTQPELLLQETQCRQPALQLCTSYCLSQSAAKDQYENVIHPDIHKHLS